MILNTVTVKLFFLLEISGYHSNQVFIITEIHFHLSLFFKLTDYSVTELYYSNSASLKHYRQSQITVIT